MFELVTYILCSNCINHYYKGQQHKKPTSRRQICCEDIAHDETDTVRSVDLYIILSHGDEAVDLHPVTRLHACIETPPVSFRNKVPVLCNTTTLVMGTAWSK